MSWGGDTDAPLAQPLNAARGLVDAGDGLVVVLFRRGAVVAAEHWDDDDVDIAAVVATAHGAQEAVFLVVGTPRRAGRVMLAADLLRAQLTNIGIRVGAVVHIPVLEDGALWTDLSATPRTGSGVLSWAATRLRNRRARVQRPQPARADPISGRGAGRNTQPDRPDAALPKQHS
ncbi:hypothetical protein [Nocardia brasiliensis]|uniref:hypothetical protein n=1 Tax=Nocardia brasiliensis TaxID=37326 RepID=UPI00245506AD|nr:hypothetical protein [Nocardia brasiliensis]